MFPPLTKRRQPTQPLDLEGFQPETTDTDTTTDQPPQLDLEGFEPLDTVDLSNKTAPVKGHYLTEQAPPNTNLGEDIWTELNRPHLDLTLMARDIANRATANLNVLPKGDNLISRIQRWGQNNPLYRTLQSFNAGATEGLAGVASGLSSDLGIASMLPEGIVLKAAPEAVQAAKIIQNLRRGANAAIAIHGGGQLVSPDTTLSERLMGGIEAAGGLAGALHAPELTKPTAPLKDIGEAITAPPEYQQPELKFNLPEFHQPSLLDEFVPPTNRPGGPPSGGSQLPLTEIPEPERTNQGRFDLDFQPPNLSSKFRNEFGQPEVLPERNPAGEVPEHLSSDYKGKAKFAFDWPGIGKMYNVEGGPNHGSTLSAESLKEYGIPIESETAASKNEAHNFVNNLPDKGNYKKSPFPKAPDEVTDYILKNKTIDYDNPTVEEIPLNKIAGTQDTVTPDVVKDYVDKGERPPITELPRPGRMPDVDAPVAIKVGDEYILAGGHHRATADLANGKNSVEAITYDAEVPSELLDKLKTSLAKDKQLFEGPAESIINFPKGGKRQITDITEQLRNSLDNEDLHNKLMRDAEDIIYRENNPETIKDNFNQLDQHLDWAKIHGSSDEIESIGTLRDMALDRMRGNGGPAESKVTGKMGIKANIPRLGNILGTNLYEGKIHKVTTKELIQNSLDAIEGMGNRGKINVHFDRDNNTITVEDNGKGMNFNDVNTVLTTLGESGKASEEGARGGFGLAKASFLLGSKNVEIETVGRNANGQLEKTILKGSPQELLHNEATFTTEPVQEGTPTGTKVKVSLPEDKGMGFYDATEFMKNLHQHSEFPGELKLTDYRREVSLGTRAPLKEINTLGDADTKIHLKVPDEPHPDKVGRINIIIRNKGLYQGEDHIYPPDGLRGVPNRVIVDVDSNVPEGSVDKTYPFTANREGLVKEYKDKVKEYIENEIIKPARKKQKNELNESWANMPKYGNLHVFDDKGLFTNDEIKSIMSNPVSKNLGSFTKLLLDQILNKVNNPSWTDRLERVGLSLDPGHYGVHVPHPDSGKSGIFINIGAHLDKPVDEAAMGLVHTILHESAHIEPLHYGDAHNQDFTTRLGNIQTKLGAEATINAIRNAKNIISVNGQYRPEVSELLQTYNGGIGRTPSKTSTFAGQASSIERPGNSAESTGVLPENTGRSGKKAVRPVQLGKKLTAEFNKPIKPAPPEEIKQVQTEVPQAEIPKRISNISKHVEPDALKGMTEDEKEHIIRKALNFQRTLLTSYDVSGPGRQGLPLIGRKEWWNSLDDMVKSWGSETAFKNVMQSIEDDPSGFFSTKPTKGDKGSLAYQAGLDLTDALSKREEIFRSQIAEKYIPGVRPSVRAYTAFLNKLRADTFKNLVREAGAENNIEVAKQIANFINISTGRGSLGAFEPSAKAMADIFFAPRFTASRIQNYTRVLNPRTYSSATNPIVRREILKSALATAGTGLLIGKLAEMAGAHVSHDPYSADFGKIRFGKTRIDPFAGHQQFLVAAARLLMGKETSSTSGRTYDLTRGGYGKPTRADVAGRLISSKLAPLPSFVWAWMQGKEFDGTPFVVRKALLNRTVPIVAQDIRDILAENPTLAQLSLGSAASVGGFGVQTYGR